MFQASSGNSDIHIAKAPGQEPGAFAISTNNTNQHEQTIQDAVKHPLIRIHLDKIHFTEKILPFQKEVFFLFFLCFHLT